MLTSTVLAKAAKTAEQLVDAVGPQVKYADLLLRGDGDMRSGASPIDEDTRKIVEHIVLRNANGDFDARDREYLITVVSSRTSLSPSQASDRVEEVGSDMKADVEKAKDLANRARKVGVVVGFFTASTLAIGAAAAWSSAKRGARHRDEGVISEV